MKTCTMDFQSLIQLLSRTHSDEIRRLQQRIAQLESVENDCSSEPPTQEPRASRPRERTLVIRQGCEKDVVSNGDDDVQNLHIYPTTDIDIDIIPAYDSQGDTRVASVYSNVEIGENYDLAESRDSDIIEDEDNEITLVCQRWSALVKLTLRDNLNFNLREGWRDGLPTIQSSGQLGDDDSMVRTYTSLEQAFMSAVARERNYLALFENASMRGRTSVRVRAGVINLQQHRVLVMHPTSKKRTTWVFVCSILLMYEIFMVTAAPFGVGESAWAEFLDVFCACFWSVDILVNFCSGIYVNGRAEMKLIAIARKYLRTWFTFDVLIVIMQWIGILYHAADVVGTTGFLIKAVRFMRFLRLARLQSWMRVEEMASSGLGPTAFYILHSLALGSKVVKFLFAAMLFLHCVTCAWYEVGQSSDGWVSQHGDLLERGAFHHYLVAMHWSLSQFQGSVDVFPGRSMANRGFACLSLGVSIVCLALFLGSFTELLVSLSEERRRDDQEFRTMNTLLHRHIITPSLLARATHYIRTKEKERAIRRTLESDEQALQLFPPRLRELIRAEVITPHVCALPVFAYLRELHARILVSICATAVTNQPVMAEDDLFQSPRRAKHIYFIAAGEMLYQAELRDFFGDSASARTLSRRKSIDSNDSVSTVDLQIKKRLTSNRYPIARLGKGAIVNEAALWMSFSHEGDLSCTRFGNCFVLDGDAFIQAVAPDKVVSATLAEVARDFLDTVILIKRHTDERFFLELLDSFKISKAAVELSEYKENIENESSQNSSPLSRSARSRSELSDLNV